MIKEFIKETEYTFDLGNIYKHFLLNKDQIEPSLAVEAFHSMMSFKKTLKPKAYIPFYPKNWAFVKKTLDEYHANNVQSKPNEYYFIPTTFDESKLEQEEKDQIHASTAISFGDGGQSYDWERWKPYQYDIYSLIEDFNIEWQDTEDHKYWLSWYLTLLDESAFNNNLLTFLCSFTKLNNNDLSLLLEDLRIKNLVIFQLLDWDKKLKKLFQPKKELKEEITVGKKIEIRKPVTRKKGDLLTELTATQTNILFRYLQDIKIIIKDPELQSSLNLAKLVSGLTGYNIDGQRNPILRPARKDKQKIIEKLKKCIALIESDLK